MATPIELTLDSNAFADWTFWDAIRDLVSNAIDATKEYHGATFRVEHVFGQKDKCRIGKLIIANDGCVMPLETLLIGYSSKHSEEYIGRFGEGFKAAIVTLLRLGYDVKIRNGSQTWMPVIGRSKRFNADTLQFEIQENRKPEPRVQFEISDVSETMWNSVRENFLFCSLVLGSQKVRVAGGEILTDEKYRGKLYSKGVFVEQRRGYSFGYNFDSAKLDRDRRHVIDAEDKVANLLANAISSGKLIDAIYSMLEQEIGDTRSLYYCLDSDGKRAIVNKFETKYGKGTIPASRDDQVVQLAHFGLRGVTVPYVLRSILSEDLGIPEKALEKCRFSIFRMYQENELTSSEQINLRFGKDLLNKAVSQLGWQLPERMIDNLLIVDFADSNLGGTFDTQESNIRIARSTLSSVGSFLRSAVHEVAHLYGLDGTKNHETAMGDLNQALFDLMLEG